jgi:hypothetical protein
MKIRYFFALFLIAISGQKQPLSAAVSASATQAQQKNPADARIEQAIRTKLAKSKLNADHFTVSVTKGVATIEGTTSVVQHKGAMTRIAKTSGAVSVRNNIRITDAGKAKATAALAKARAASTSPATPPATSPAPTATSPATAPAPPAAIPRAVVISGKP